MKKIFFLIAITIVIALNSQAQIIKTVAGNGYEDANGSGGYSGDGGSATSAELNYPEGVALEASGSLFIADFANFRIRKVSSNGIIATVVVNGKRGYSDIIAPLKIKL